MMHEAPELEAVAATLTAQAGTSDGQYLSLAFVLCQVLFKLFWTAVGEALADRR